MKYLQFIGETISEPLSDGGKVSVLEKGDLVKKSDIKDFSSGFYSITIDGMQYIFAKEQFKPYIPIKEIALFTALAIALGFIIYKIKS